MLEIFNLLAKRRVTCLQCLGSFTETKLFGDCREVTKVSEFHFCWSA